MKFNDSKVSGDRVAAEETLVNQLNESTHALTVSGITTFVCNKLTILEWPGSGFRLLARTADAKLGNTNVSGCNIGVDAFVNGSKIALDACCVEGCSRGVRVRGPGSRIEISNCLFRDTCDENKTYNYQEVAESGECDPASKPAPPASSHSKFVLLSCLEGANASIEQSAFYGGGVSIEAIASSTMAQQCTFSDRYATPLSFN